MKTVLVTGATSGIGRCIADKLHKSGFNVYGTSRFPEKHQHNVGFELLPLDITSRTSIQNCISIFLSKSVIIDVLINNAGIGVCGSAEETSPELAEKQFQTNFWGVVNMTKAVLPLMRKQQHGHIITIGSLAGLIAVPFQSYYSASKHALEGFLKTLRIEVRSFNIKISIIEPGFFKTEIHHAFELAEPCIRDYDLIRTNAIQVLHNSVERAPSPDPVVRKVLKIIHSENPGVSYRIGRFTKLAPWMQFTFYRLLEYALAIKFRIRSLPFQQANHLKEG
jgi:short-subunit dehydrogenase